MDSGFGKVIVDYTKFIITPDTEIDVDDGELVMGAFVDVEAEHHDGKLLATKIRVLAEATDTVRFEGGRITKLDLGMYKVVVEGTTFKTTVDTKIDEGLMVGDFVKVEADRVDDKLIATKITLIDSILEE